MKKQIIVSVITVFFLVITIQGQEKVYDLDLQKAYKQIKVGHLDLTGKSQDGKRLEVKSS